MTPETHYALSGDVNIAYQVIGNGPRDLILVPGWVSNIEVLWEEPIVARFLRRLASTHTVRELVAGSGLRFESRGTHTLKGVPGEWRLFAAVPQSAP